ncbi:SDR family oxidoreductase [Solicola sp. PLA-1-18]|uniref:SDR family oxidoreductase n=1 Tax=Solicola sp. PLA-1-18 TaxID=3380532 RepID=UPI003B7DB384
MSTPTSLVAVTGASGAIGGGVARRLAAAGVPQRLVVRDASRAPELPGAEVVVATYGDAGAVRDALVGVDTVLMVSAHESDDRIGEHRTFVESAAEAGVRQVVYLSFVGASATSGFLLGRDHGATEDVLRASGLEWTFLRDNFYAEMLPAWAGDDGALRGPARDGRVAAVAQDDVADVAAAVLQDPRAHAGRTYDLTGPEALTFDEVAAILTDVTGRPHTYVDETMDQARASRSGYDAPDWLVDAWISTYTAIADGELADVSDDVATLTGHPATPITEVVARTARAD